VKSISRRRQRIFDESGGRCHYCSTPLTLDGKWHIEHKMPRALGGDDEPGNLVAACVPCNFKKRDTTDLEFKAKLAKESPGAA
jgi:5-methylcytosine-specific restriction endonuclease McrA